MKIYTRLSEEQKQALLDRYVSGENMKDLCAEYGIDYSTGYAWLKEAGLSARKTFKKKNTQKKVCWKCGHEESNPQACFCSMCGSKLKTETDLLIDSLQYINKLTQFLPQTTRDEVITIVNKTVAYIKSVERERGKNGNGMC